MANFLYNGVELPDINTVWTDKENFPHALITYYPAGSIVTLYLTRYPFAEGEPMDDGTPRFYSHSGVSERHIYNLTDGVWVESTTLKTDYVMIWAVGGGYDTPVWSNYDIAYNDGTVLISVGGQPILANSKLKISAGGGANGDGYALYNGVKLPNIESVWDKTNYPYVQIYRMSDPNTFCLILDEMGCTYVDDEYYYLVGTSTCLVLMTLDESLASQAGLTVGTWTLMEQTTDSVKPSSMDLSLIWSSHNIVDTGDLMGEQDDTVVFAASDPIPLDGMTVIEWDGDTTGLESGLCTVDSDGNTISLGTLYRISDYVSTPTDNFVVVDENPTLGTEAFVLSASELMVTNGGSAWALGVSIISVDNGGVYTFDYSGTYYDFTAERSGLYCMERDISFITLFAYPASDGGSVTSTTVTAEFTCTDLVNAGAIDSIHAWVYKKSDGLNTTISPTWTSELFKAPSYSTSHTFTGLTPNTEYEVYGCIFVNGEATDHDAIAAFTTLEGESITFDKTAFLSGMAMGLTGKGDPTFTASDTFTKGYKVGAALRRKRVIV